jgi:chromosome partitioning protein
VHTILVANPKGGSGKTTLATNIAGWLAGKRQRVGLQDADPQGSSTQWLSRRPSLFPSIAGFRADAMVVPVSPSLFDMAATADFLGAIADYKSVREGGLAVGLVAVRVDARTRAAGELDDFLKQGDFPVITHLRDTQVYVHCARDGLSVFDLPRSRGEQDSEQWRPLTRWLARNAAVRT